MNKLHAVILLFLVLAMVVSITLSELAKKNQVPIILCLGDSITYSSLGSYAPYLDKLLDKKHVKAKVYTIARLGNSSGEYLGFLKECNLIGLYPRTLILLMLGSNDVRLDRQPVSVGQFSQNMNEIVDVLISRTGMRGPPFPIFIALIPPILTSNGSKFDWTSARRIEEEINPAISAIAEKRHLQLVDIHELFVKNPDLLFEVHPLPEGSKRMAQQFYTAILPFLK